MNTKISWLCICVSVGIVHAGQREKRPTRSSIQDDFVKAAAYDDEALLKVFLEDQELKDLGFDVDVKDEVTGWTALHAALRCNNYRASKLLLDHGATFKNTALPGETKYTRLLKTSNPLLLLIQPPEEVDESTAIEELLYDWKSAVLSGNIPFIQVALRLHYLNPWALTSHHIHEIKKTCKGAFSYNRELRYFLEERAVRDCPICLEGFSVVEIGQKRFCKDLKKPENWKHTAALSCGHTVHTTCFDKLIIPSFGEDGEQIDASSLCPECRFPMDFTDTLERIEVSPVPEVIIPVQENIFDEEDEEPVLEQNNEEESEEDLDVELEEESANSDWEESTDV